jgi:hypothetical protein
MKKGAQATERGKSASVSDAQAAKPLPVFLPPLKRRAGLFYALLVAVAVWIATLLTLYFVTVHSRK